MYAALSLTELVAIRARDQPDLVAFHTGIDEPGDPLRSLTYSQIQQAIDRLCKHYATLNMMLPKELPQRTIAVLTSTAIDESLLEIALSKLGLAPLLLSVNNSVQAVAHLCKVTKASHLIYGLKYCPEAKGAQTLLAEQGYQLETVPERQFPLWGPNGIEAAGIPPFPALLTPKEEAERTAVILHSSGSTGFPKPVFITHKGIIANLHGHIAAPGFSTLPVYHGFGHFGLFRCYYNAVPLTLFPPHLPLTSANICRIIKTSPTPCKQCFAVPYIIKLLAETEEGTRALAAFEVVSYSGAAIPDDLGDRLTAAGVNLLGIYGTTETGGLLNSKRDFATDKAWNWLRADGLILEYMVMENRGSNSFEIIIKDGWPPKIEANRPDGSFATKDLFLRHEKHHNWYKYIGRLDDTLVQTLGEKTNPVPIELAIRGNSPYVAEAIVFGAGRPQVGCLILPSELGKELSADREAFLEKIWPVVKEANAQAPTHSRLLPEMICILEYGTQIPVATKMSILRPACYIQFKDIIDAVYDRFENGTGVAKLDLSISELEDFISNAIIQTIGVSKATDLKKTTDLFTFGVDSLQATRIRNVCQKKLELNGKTLGLNVVYENPSIEKLVRYMWALRYGEGNIESESEERQHATMLSMVEKWSSELHIKQVPSLNEHVKRPISQVIVLTGATGSLGAHILQQLVCLPSVSKVICLSRAKSHAESLSRVQDSLRLRQRNLSFDDWVKIESLAASVNEEKLGLTEAEYAYIQSQATAVIHNAWPVNFVLDLNYFDKHVGGVVNLINLCLYSTIFPKPSFFFSSSIGTCQDMSDPICFEAFPSYPNTASSTGYARSKWVVEKVCQYAAQHTLITIGILRIGQLVGDTENGIWNQSEAWPLMFKFANTAGILPRLDEQISWLPVDIAGRAIVEIVNQENPSKAAVYHVLNPNTTSNWDVILSGLRRAGIRFDVVTGEEWLDRLAKSDPDGARNPTIKLLNFYRNRFGNRNQPPKPIFCVDLTSKVAPSIANSPAISQELVGLWVEHWRSTTFMADL